MKTNNSNAQLLGGKAFIPSRLNARYRHTTPGTKREMWFPAQIATDVKIPANANPRDRNIRIRIIFIGLTRMSFYQQKNNPQ